MKNTTCYIIFNKEDRTRWGMADSYKRVIPLCKYLLNNIKSANNFTIVWNESKGIKEDNLKEFCIKNNII